MRFSSTTASILGIAACAIACTLIAAGEDAKAPAPQAPAPELKTEKDKASYFLGNNIGRRLRQDGIEIDTKLLLRGLEDAMSGAKSLVSQDEAQKAFAALQAEGQARKSERDKAAADRNKAEGAAYLAANAKKEGVTALPSGLQYKVIVAGTGEKPKATDRVTTHYRGTLIDGTEFDSSYSRGEPATFEVGGVIKGWTEALQLMPVGSKWQIVVPSELAYAERGAGEEIGPNATLLFEIELISIQK